MVEVDDEVDDEVGSLVDNRRDMGTEGTKGVLCCTSWKT
jgi:hypothetical protein